jgi:hypothetical protein
MISPDEQAPDKEAPKPKPSRSEEALRIIEEYANDMREIIKKLRRLLHIERAIPHWGRSPAARPGPSHTRASRQPTRPWCGR